ncbi:hypothetical protein BMETH_999_0 [methanotrophic bacterial endosymbiont of Bathymodiolus sp.]|nr:hypothetical protein BMETH_999_0 [methanotrophic bacterial endosymbiont of Bathymodiolus sp.]
MPEDKAFFAFYNTCDTTRFPVFKDSIIFRFRQNNSPTSSGDYQPSRSLSMVWG